MEDNKKDSNLSDFAEKAIKDALEGMETDKAVSTLTSMVIDLARLLERMAKQHIDNSKLILMLTNRIQGIELALTKKGYSL